MQSHINVNRVVLQGGILLPWLFNIYIDDLVRSLKEVGFEVLAYTDDEAFICKNRQELDKLIDLQENWATTNGISCFLDMRIIIDSIKRAEIEVQ